MGWDQARDCVLFPLATEIASTTPVLGHQIDVYMLHNEYVPCGLPTYVCVCVCVCVCG